MMQFQVLGSQLQAELFVFDKDGLLFDSQIFWSELAKTRAYNFTRLIGDEELMVKWLEANGVIHNSSECYKVDPLGILAAASPEEEINVLAGFLAEHLKLTWVEARDIARNVFKMSDENLDFERALKPMEGFPGIFNRLRNKRIPYGIATSDTYERTKLSIQQFDDWESINFVVTPKDVSKGKPDREMIDKIAEATNIKNSEIVMLGDSYLDVSMANSAGAIGIGVTSDPEMKKRMQPFTKWIVDSLDQIIF